MHEGHSSVRQQTDRQRQQSQRHDAARDPTEPRHLGDDQREAKHQPEPEEEQRGFGVAHPAYVIARSAATTQSPLR